MQNDLYLESGYLNQKYIEDLADKYNISFIVEIGARQVGKTYGALKLMLDEKKNFILMRRTMTELDFITKEVSHPFKAFKDYDVTVKKDSKYTGAIYNNIADSDPQFIGSCMALSTVAKIRGFNGLEYTDMVFDEFIPENHVTKIRDEGDAFTNAYVTIAGAREENGLKPLRCWLLANANTINNPILYSLNISEKIEKMKNNGQEFSILKDRGIIIILPDSKKITEKRSKTALYRAIGTASKFASMSLSNEFSYNDSTDIIRANIKEYKLKLVYDGIGIYVHKSKNIIFCTDFITGSVTADRNFTDSEKDKRYIRRTYNFIREAIIKRSIYYSNLTIKGIVLDMMDI